MTLTGRGGREDKRKRGWEGKEKTGEEGGREGRREEERGRRGKERGGEGKRGRGRRGEERKGDERGGERRDQVSVNGGKWEKDNCACSLLCSRFLFALLVLVQ